MRGGLICVFSVAVRGSAAPRKLEKTRSSYSVHRVGGSRGAPKIKVQVLVAVCRTPSLKPPRAQARGPSDDPVSLEPRRAADFFGFLWLFGYETRARGRTCVKPRQSSPGSKGNDRKHARAPFSAVRATRKLKVDGFSSSRGALHDAHHEKAPHTKNPAAVGRRPLGAGPAGRSAAARRPPGRLRPGGAPPPNGRRVFRVYIYAAHKATSGAARQGS